MGLNVMAEPINRQAAFVPIWGSIQNTVRNEK